MLPLKSRFKKEDFESIKNFKRKSFSSKNFTLKLYDSAFSPSRFAIVVSKNFSKSAVNRNRIKRQIKGIINKNIKEIKNGFAIIIYIKKEVKEKINFKETQKEIINLFKKSNILK